VGDVIEIGECLAQVKARLDHGQWLPWLKAEFGWSEQAARKFMSVHRMVESKSLKFSDLEPIDVSALYLLAAPSTPEPAREGVAEAAAEGARVTHQQAQAAVGAAKEAAKRPTPTLPVAMTGSRWSLSWHAHAGSGPIDGFGPSLTSPRRHRNSTGTRPASI
jgi:hypothetical protein